MRREIVAAAADAIGEACTCPKHVAYVEGVARAVLAAAVGALPDIEVTPVGTEAALERQEFEALVAGCETGEVAAALARARTAILADERDRLLAALSGESGASAPAGGEPNQPTERT